MDPVELAAVAAPALTAPLCTVHVELAATVDVTVNVVEAELVVSRAESFNHKEAVEVPDPGE